MSLWSHDHVVHTPSGVSVEDVRDDPPQFARVYTGKLNDTAIKVTIKRFLGSMMKYGELTQGNGRWVTFDPDAIADKILDPVLVPLVQNFVNEAFAMDKVFRDPEPASYTDKRGTLWRRA